jgi:hypothetical protein
MGELSRASMLSWLGTGPQRVAPANAGTITPGLKNEKGRCSSAKTRFLAGSLRSQGRLVEMSSVTNKVRVWIA